MTTPISRRRVLTMSVRGATALGAARILTACANSLPDDARRAVPSSSLRILNWPVYIDTGDQGTVARFRSASKIDVQYSEDFNDNNSVYADVLAPALSKGRAPAWDIVCPTFWLAGRLIDQGWAEALPLESIPNHVNLDVTFLRQPVDRGARFNLPWQSGITGIAYNSNTVKPVTSINDLLTRSDLKGKVGFFSEMRDSIGLAMLSLSSDPSRATLADAQAAIDRLEKAVADGQIIAFADNAGYLAALKSGKFAACVAWSGDLVQLQADRKEFAFSIPDEGAMQWFDTMVIPRGAANPGSAAAWMDFVYDPANAARITATVQYVSPVVGVRDELVKLGGASAKLADNTLLFPDEVTRRRLFTWHGTSVAEEDALAARFGKLPT